MAATLKRAIIVGSSGQDGQLLFDQLQGDNCAVLGIARMSTKRSGECTPHIDIADRIQVRKALDDFHPDAVFYLPAVHASATGQHESDGSLFERSVAVHLQYAVNFLEAISASHSDAAFFYAGSSHVFAGAKSERQTENTPLVPESIYGITKAAGIQACRFFRTHRKVRASVGFLYNHESHLRPDGFVSQRIVKAAVSAASGDRSKLILGNLNACVDWGYAPEFVDAMVRIAKLPQGDDYIIATDRLHSVREFAEEAFACVGLDWRDHVVEQPDILSRQSVTLVGDYQHLRERTGWKPRVSFQDMVRMLVDRAGANAC